VPETATDKENAQGEEACSAGISKVYLNRLIFLSRGSVNFFCDFEWGRDIQYLWGKGNQTVRASVATIATGNRVADIV